MEDVPEVSPSVAGSLYDEDFYAWTQEQAALMRRGRVARLDLQHVLEEIEALGRKEIAELLSRTTVLAQHLLKQMYQPEKASRSWRTTILDQRIQIARHIRENPSLTSKADFVEAYADARDLAALETGLPLGTFPEMPPFSKEQALDRAWEPLKRT